MVLSGFIGGSMNSSKAARGVDQNMEAKGMGYSLELLTVSRGVGWKKMEFCLFFFFFNSRAASLRAA